MRRMVVTSSVLALLVSLVVPVYAQDTKEARGTVSAIAGDTVTVKAGTQELKVMVDAKTTIVTEGGGTATRAAVAKGAAGPKLGELLKVGEAVEVSYRESGGALYATNVRRVSSAGAGGGGGTSVATRRHEVGNGQRDGDGGVQHLADDLAGRVQGASPSPRPTPSTRTRSSWVREPGPLPRRGRSRSPTWSRRATASTVTYVPSGSTIRATEVRVRPS